MFPRVIYIVIAIWGLLSVLRPAQNMPGTTADPAAQKKFAVGLVESGAKEGDAILMSGALIRSIVEV